MPVTVVGIGLALSLGFFGLTGSAPGLALGLMFTVGAGGYAFTLTHRETIINRRVDERTQRYTAAHAALAGETRLMQAVLHTVADGVAVTDAQGKVLIWNPAAEALLGPRPTGTDPAEWLGEIELFEVGHATPVPVDQAPLSRILAGHDGGEVECYTHGGSDGEGRWLRMSGRRLADAQGQLRGAVLVFQDITAEKQAERRMRNLNALLERRVAARTAELRRSNEDLQQFAFIASHDLQEPLRKVRMFGDRLRIKYGDALDERGLDYLERMQRASARMEGLLTNLLSLSRVSTRGGAFAATDLRQVAREVVSDLEVRIRETGASVEIGDLPTIEADRTQMRQLLQNLIVNALKFRKPDVAPHIGVQAEQVAGEDGAYCRLRVTDNGIGFEPKYAEQIFVPLQRLHGAAAYEGTGIGLAVCRKIVERHGGTITATGTPGEGAAFDIVLPVAQQSEESEG